MVGLGRVVLSTREYVIALEPRNRGIVGLLLHYPYEVREPQSYDPEQIEANHEAFVRGVIVRSSAVDALLGSGAGLVAITRSQSETRKRRPRKR